MISQGGMMRSAKDVYIDLLAQGFTQDEIDDELLCQMMDEEREGLELQHESQMESLEHVRKVVQNAN